MRTLAPLLIPLLVLVACGDDEPAGTGGAGGASSATTGQGTAGQGTGGGVSTSSSGGSGGQGTGGGALEVPCGEATCRGGDHCLVVPVPPECFAADDAGGCPEGTTPTICGGAGGDCCCSDPPPPVTSCVASPGCEGVPACACLVDPCAPDRECRDTGTPGEVQCAELPRP